MTQTHTLDALGLPELAAIAAFCARYPIRRLSVFGSALRDDFADDSDLDVLVEFEPDAPVTLPALAQMQRELSLLVGRPVDFLTEGFLSPYFRQSVLDQAVVWFEKAA
jgi:predicted nucleotidyltransferase